MLGRAICRVKFKAPGVKKNSKLTWPYGHGYGYVISMNQIAAGKFKDQCLKLLDTVAQTKSPIVITKRGRPVAALVPYVPPQKAIGYLASYR